MLLSTSYFLSATSVVKIQNIFFIYITPHSSFFSLFFSGWVSKCVCWKVN